MVTIGVDTHTATLAASAVDGAGRELAARTFQNDGRGHQSLLRWASSLSQERRFGIEGSGSYGAALARLLGAAGEAAVEVPAILTQRERRHLRRAGKSDPGDGQRVTRVALARPPTATALALAELGWHLAHDETGRHQVMRDRRPVRGRALDPDRGARRDRLGPSR